ncbi:hypothetical protein DJ82_10140 [Halorubrum sp. Ib24]|uniref:DUF7097 family protein n=1 Tax=unclassified Halorubrum TaxID=2642239 RepID=UPI000B989B09|nr:MULTISPECIES: hypothetical protein [unclassified Halorubrum]OYR38803.1 hypothetical protein DJ82_10140 [Halorubrum sp. Ib24]OYR44978.1 hypothetical protein DJ81_06180 [Halorubrum sp. Hd13]OYR50342.1 hypothetical protein DJ73_16060 [Halorubrum sp. Ea1]OYR50776.1 hypothetical protein DJ74_05480 [Halorubrum sp. Ea8]
MERTPDGTPVGVDDPYAVAGVCDHLTDDGRCRFALTRAGDDPAFAAARRADGYACHVGPDGAWRRCPHYRSTTDGRECHRCGLEEVRIAHDDERPLVEEHHLSYGSAGGGEAGNGNADGDEEGEAGPHEITVALCRWCHTKVHKSFARIDDDASPDPEAIAERESRNGRQQEELSFGTAAERFDPDADDET